MKETEKKILSNIGEAVIDTVLTALDVCTFGITTNAVDLTSTIFQHFKDTKRQHALKQLAVFYETPSRLNVDDFEGFKEKHKNYEEIILDLIKTLDLTIDRKQSKMLAKLIECYILREINQDTYLYWKYIVVKLDGYLIGQLDVLYQKKGTHFSEMQIIPDFWNFNFVNKIPSSNVIMNGMESSYLDYTLSKNFINFYESLCI